MNRLRDIIPELDKRFRYAVEVRDSSWFQDLAYSFFANNNMYMYGLESTCCNKNSSNSYIRFSLYKIHWNNLTNAVLKELSKDRLFSSVVRSEQEIQMRDLIDKNLDRVLFIQKNQPRPLLDGLLS